MAEDRAVPDYFDKVIEIQKHLVIEISLVIK